MSKNSVDQFNVSPALPPGATLLEVPDMCRGLKQSKPVVYGFIEDGTLPTFTVGTRRFCTVEQLQQCIQTLAERGKNSPKPSAKRGPQYGRPSDKKQHGRRVSAR